MRRLVLTTALPALAILALPMAAQAVEPAPTPPSPVIAGEESTTAACGPAGVLCFQDYASGRIGNVRDRNADWSKLSGDWGGKADWFYGNASDRTFYVYPSKSYRGDALKVGYKEVKTKANFGWSNGWS